MEIQKKAQQEAAKIITTFIIYMNWEDEGYLLSKENLEKMQILLIFYYQ